MLISELVASMEVQRGNLPSRHFAITHVSYFVQTTLKLAANLLLHPSALHTSPKIPVIWLIKILRIIEL